MKFNQNLTISLGTERGWTGGKAPVRHPMLRMRVRNALNETPVHMTSTTSLKSRKLGKQSNLVPKELLL
jgi:hypothetical protein